MSSFKNELNRRAFLSGLTAGGLSLTACSNWENISGLQAEETSDKTSGTSPVSETETSTVNSSDALLDSPPVLQYPTETGISVVWAVKKLSTAWVEWENAKDFDVRKAEELTSENFALKNRADNVQVGLLPLDDRIHSVRIEGLEPNQEYVYRAATRAINYKSAYSIEPKETVFSPFYRFKTPGKDAPFTGFIVINDTHENKTALTALMKKIQNHSADFTVWNGDMLNTVENADQAIRAALRPTDIAYASEKPLLYTTGNHEGRGIWARKLPTVLTPAPQEKMEFKSLGRNFAVRQGSVALIGLDTGEDKPDANPVFGGLVCCEPYRELQARWLAETLERPDVKSAPFIVAFCHIPLFDSNPNANPGDILQNYAAWQRPCARLWGPLFEKAGVQLVITAHQHRYRFDPPTENRSWAQIVGGGPRVEDPITLIYGTLENEKLKITVFDAYKDKVLGEHFFESRL